VSVRERIRRELAQESKRAAIAQATRGSYLAKLDQWRRLAEAGRLTALRDWARDVRDEALNDHAGQLAKFTRAVAAGGGQVHLAATAEAAVQQVLAILQNAGARRVVKAKSMVTEEIGLVHALEAAGLEALETDLGEYIIQLAGEMPSHITGPALHLTRHDVAALFSARLGETVEPEPQALAAVARRVLRAKFLAADAGITGANFLVAETGSVVLVTNEGNADLTTALPRVMITIAGLEKLVPTWAALEPLLTLLPRTATGQNMTTYVTAIAGTRQPGEADGPEELHVVVLDAGRAKLLGTPQQDVLRCIRCGSCLDACPVFRQVGGHGYGTVYSGPIGVALTPLLNPDSSGLLDLCSLCGACTEGCPVHVPLHHLIRAERAMRKAGTGERLLMRLWAWAWSDPARYRFTSRLLRLVTRPFVRAGHLTWLPGPLGEWGRGRDFPAPAAKPLHERWRDLDREVEP
jgi:L-lactate dehydrogenase complex protein LldF